MKTRPAIKHLHAMQLILSASFALLLFQASVAQQKADSLQLYLKTAKEDTLKIQALNLLANEFRNNDPDQAITLANQAIQLSEKLHFEKGKGVANVTKGTAITNLGKYDDALLLMKEGLKQSFASNDKKNCGRAYNNMANVYRHQGNYPEALSNYLKGLKIREEIGDKPGIAFSYTGIGNIYYAQNNYAEALKNYFLSLKVREQIGDKRGTADSYSGIGNIYFDQKNYKEAMKYYQLALQIQLAMEDVQGQAYTYNNIALVNEANMDYDLALNNYKAAIKIYEVIGNKQGIANSSGNMGTIFLKKHLTREAKIYLQKTLSLAKEIGSKEDIRTAHLMMAKVDSAYGDYDEALKNYRQSIVYRDSLIGEENTKKTVQTQMQFDFDKKEAATKAEQNKKDALVDAEKKRQNILLSLICAALILVIVIAVYVFRTLQTARKQNEEIEEQKKLLEWQKDLVETKQIEIMDSIVYARRIQQSLLPTEKYIQRTINRMKKQ